MTLCMTGFGRQKNLTIDEANLAVELQVGGG